MNLLLFEYSPPGRVGLSWRFAIFFEEIRKMNLSWDVRGLLLPQYPAILKQFAYL